MKHVGFFLISIIIVFALFTNNNSDITKSHAESTQVFDYCDALMPPDIPKRTHCGSPPGYWDTSEYLIGSVSVGIIFLESNETTDPSTEDWTTVEESNVINEITAGLNWLANQNPSAGVSFTFDVHYEVPTRYEPINRPSSHEGLWISEAMTFLGYHGTYYFTQVRNYINDLRDKLGTDWAYVMFIVDSSNDVDGRFTDGWFAYAYLGGPFLVMTYDNDGYGIGNMDFVSAHETCHIFYATDEYNGVTEYSGYLNIRDNERSGDMMDKALSWWLCTNSREQLGWRDTDGDGIQDIVDTFPDTTLNPYSPDPTTNTILTYTGSVIEIPYPNMNPYGPGNDVTINTIRNVEFRVDLSDNWMSATPTDGTFDEDEEGFTFATYPLSIGMHTIKVRGINSVGNIEMTYASDTIKVIVARFPTIQITDSDGNVRDEFLPADSVYIKGFSYQPSTIYDLYVVKDINWSDGKPIPSNVPGTETNVTTDENGKIPITVVWNYPLLPGKYDILIDVNGNGKYDEDIDALCDGNIKVTAGFFVIPELPLGTAMALILMLGSLMLLSFFISKIAQKPLK